MYPCEMKNKFFLEQALGPVPQRMNFLLGDFLWGGHASVPLTSRRFRFLFHSNCLYPQGVLWSYVRSTDAPPLASAVFMYRNSIEEFLCRFDSRDAISLPHPLFPVYRFFFPVAKHRKLWRRGFMSPSTDSGSLTTEIILRHRVKPS